MTSIKPLAAAFLLASALGSGARPAAAQYCEGVVHGLSGRYDPATGSGFLAVRAAPSSRSALVGEFFNGDKTEILRRQGAWYRVAIGGIDGWAYARYIRNSCGY